MSPYTTQHNTTQSLHRTTVRWVTQHCAILRLTGNCHSISPSPTHTLTILLCTFSSISVSLAHRETPKARKTVRAMRLKWAPSDAYGLFLSASPAVIGCVSYDVSCWAVLSNVKVRGKWCRSIMRRVTLKWYKGGCTGGGSASKTPEGGMHLGVCDKGDEVWSYVMGKRRTQLQARSILYHDIEFSREFISYGDSTQTC